MENLIKNGDFSQDGAYWEDKYVIYQDGKALISDKGYAQQVIELNSPFEKGGLITMSCDVSDLNGLFHVKCNGFEHITPLGGHRIYKLNLPAGTKSVELKFIAENSYTLDNVELTIEDYDTEVDLIQNGDFSQHGKHWKGERVNYYNGTALVATGGYIGQEVQLSSPLKAGSAVKVSFTLSNLYGSQVRVLVNGVDHPYISDAGDHVLEFILEKDTDTLRLQFTTNNTFTLDDVKMVVSL